MYATRAVILSFLVFFSVSRTLISANNGIPSKFLNPYEVYAKNEYIAAVGVGDTLDAARSAALSALSQQIQVSVKSAQQTEESFLMNTARGLSGDTSLVGSTDIRSIGNFIGVQYGESFLHHDKQIYTIAYIHRISTGNAYVGRIEDATKTIHALLDDASSKSDLEQYAMLLRAIALSTENDEMLSQLDAISASMAFLARKNRKYTTDLLKNQLRTVASSIVFSTPVEVKLLYNAVEDMSAEQIQGQIKSSIVQMLTSLQFKTGGDNSGHALETVISIGKQTKKYIRLLWELSFSIKDEFGSVIMSKTQRGNAHGLDMDAAKRFAIFDMQKIITTLFGDYIRTSLVGE